MDNNPERSCVICRKKGLKKDFLRFVVKDQKAELDMEKNKTGRGFYICSDKCWEEGLKKERKVRFGSDARKARTVGIPGREKNNKFQITNNNFQN